jgi:hypothetical protein
MEYTVYIYGRRGKFERVSATIQTKADSPQAAIQHAAKIQPFAFEWYSWTYRQELGYKDDVTIFSYEVGGI